MRLRAKHGRSEADAPFAGTKREGARRGPSICGEKGTDMGREECISGYALAVRAAAV